ncbi:YggS family pyridoxal phosphate-dependent enzyme [Thermosynechococcaceae cyanobacterium BACA0444]|uniref:Pyridoxal phosphate homeostasis protein n=1 Tax=Pseudocalidococcus azoricus BACA0444 TaxID=2918990 RepID=A0AAE4FUR2_9CYAN|nr:YggS family pyridoxal phosphate-dependent enzyme [Pseudocalidococcus azoricus]MDS3861220.1 YggS family pyridoxal phosphate-dependent enzyme [Pseudocalidococcus azoricus BACA0444]
MVDCNSGASIAQRIATLRQRVPASVRLIAVSKYISPEMMRQAYAAGIRDFGENRIQEAQAKRGELADLTDITWHFIGHLQANKVRAALETFDWIHTVDSLKLAQRLQALIPAVQNSPKLLLQVKLRPDPQKYGWTISELTAALPELDQLTELNIQGLMTILPLGLTPAEQLLVFQELHNLAETWQHQAWQHLSFQELSMGMSSDYPFALQAQTTMIRLGQVIFGPRSIP